MTYSWGGGEDVPEQTEEASEEQAEEQPEREEQPEAVFEAEQAVEETQPVATDENDNIVQEQPVEQVKKTVLFPSAPSASVYRHRFANIVIIIFFAGC